ncbi:MAG: TaqI-like C-terminal specificity domain-containing protein [Paludibacteraceae bacterium]
MNFGRIPKLLAPEISFGGNFMFDSNGQFYSTTTIYGYIKKEGISTSYETWLAILNSRLCWWFLKNTGTVLANGYYRYKPTYLNPMPIPYISQEDDDTIRTMVCRRFEEEDMIEKKNIEFEIDLKLFQLYGLSKDDIEIVLS